MSTTGGSNEELEEYRGEALRYNDLCALAKQGDLLLSTNIDRVYLVLKESPGRKNFADQGGLTLLSPEGATLRGFSPLFVDVTRLVYSAGLAVRWSIDYHNLKFCIIRRER